MLPLPLPPPLPLFISLILPPLSPPSQVRLDGTTAVAKLPLPQEIVRALLRVLQQSLAAGAVPQVRGGGQVRGSRVCCGRAWLRGQYPW